MSQPRILIVHPDPPSLALLSSMLKSLGHVIEEAANDRVAVRLMERGGIDMVLAGVDPADPEALELLTYVRRKHRHVPAILLFPTPSPERAKEALRLGALAVLRYPVPATELRAAVTQALGTLPARPAEPATPAPLFAPASGQNHHNHLPATASHGSSHHGVANGNGNGGGNSNGYVAPAPLPSSKADQLVRELGVVGNDPSLRQAIELAATIASARTPVLILGERGTGKSLLAKVIHSLGSRSDQPFVPVDCSALTEATFDRERSMAGQPMPIRHDPGFDWSNKVHQAVGGTLFLNDVAALSESLQLQLLRALQDREYEHAPGGDIRFLMSTSENLVGLVDQAKFRQDLYHRASVICLKLPPLRARGTDIEQLAEYFRARFSLEFGKNVVGFTRDALDILTKHDWPGNVRELEGVIQRGVALCQGTTTDHLRASVAEPLPPRAREDGRPLAPLARPDQYPPVEGGGRGARKADHHPGVQALNWNRQGTARVLDINRTTLYKKMKKYGLLVDEPIYKVN
ncbi:MAG: sigma 54-interacting transcriptional regulator [Isosphaeraceae bacterium]